MLQDYLFAGLNKMAMDSRVSQNFKKFEFLDIELHTAVYVPQKQPKIFMSFQFRLFLGVATTFNFTKGSASKYKGKI